MLRYQFQSFSRILFETWLVKRGLGFSRCAVFVLATGCTQQCSRSAEPTNWIPETASTLSSRSDASPQPILSVQSSKSPRVVTFLGDSLTAGPGLSMKETLPSVIQQKIGGSQLNWKVQNAGVSGDTTALALARLTWVLRSKPHVLVVALGANDGLRGLSLDEMERNLREIVSRAQAQNIKVVLVGQQIPFNFPEDHRVKFAGVFKKISREMKLVFVPFMLEGVALDERFVLEDGIHPNASGVQKIADLIWKVLYPVLNTGEISSEAVKSAR